MSVAIERCSGPAEAARWCARARASGRALGLVPTMGALHEGHLTLVRRALAENDLACASVFVNPLQFDDPRDLERYPREPERDVELLAGAGCSMVFSGTLEEFFPEAAGSRAEPGPDGRTSRTAIPLFDPGPSAAGLEGEHRPGHFAGVATICARLFELVRPRRAYFGEKDFQQCLVVQHVARRLGYPEIVVCPTSREPDGLARSSRNLLLSFDERSRALALSRALFAARDAWRSGEREAERLERVLLRELGRAELRLEYAVVRDPRSLHAHPSGRMERARALVAARVGSVRLIDTLALDPDSEVRGCPG